MNEDTAVQLAYLVAGADESMKLFRITERLTGRNNDHPLVASGGHIGMVSDLYSYAQIITEYLETRKGQDFPSVFEYEVTEELGAWIAKRAAAEEDYSKAAFTVELKRRGEIFWSQE